MKALRNFYMLVGVAIINFKLLEIIAKYFNLENSYYDIALGITVITTLAITDYIKEY